MGIEMKKLLGLLGVFWAGALALGATGTFIATDDQITCPLKGAQVTADGNVIMLVDCEAFSCEDVPNPPPPPPPPPPPLTGDPGSGVWNPNPNLTVFSFAAGQNRVFVPGCINGEDWHSNCPYSGSLQYGHTYSVRVPITEDTYIRVRVDRAEAQELSASVIGYASSTPGVRNGLGVCDLAPYSQHVDVTQKPVEIFPGITTPTCVLPTGVGYLSFTPTDPLCGAGGTICRVQVLQ